MKHSRKSSRNRFGNCVRSVTSIRTGTGLRCACPPVGASKPFRSRARVKLTVKYTPSSSFPFSLRGASIRTTTIPASGCWAGTPPDAGAAPDGELNCIGAGRISNPPDAGCGAGPMRGISAGAFTGCAGNAGNPPESEAPPSCPSCARASRSRRISSNSRRSSRTSPCKLRSCDSERVIHTSSPLNAPPGAATSAGSISGIA